MRIGKYTLAVAMTAVPLQLAAWPAAAQDREVRDHDGFNAIRIGYGIDLRVRQSEDFLVEVTVSGGDLEDVVTDVDNGTLQITRRRGLERAFGWFDDYAVYVTLPELVAVNASGGSDVRAEGRFSGDSLRIDASGGSDVSIEVDVTELEVRTSGGSDVRLVGTAASARVQTSGGSDLRAHDLQAAEADLRSSGGSDISISVRDRLVARASGGSDIVYTGNPAFVDINAGGSADVTRR